MDVIKDYKSKNGIYDIGTIHETVSYGKIEIIGKSRRAGYKYYWVKFINEKYGIKECNVNCIRKGTVKPNENITIDDDGIITGYFTEFGRYDVGTIHKTRDNLGGFEFKILGRAEGYLQYFIEFIGNKKYREIRHLKDIREGSIKHLCHKSIVGVGYVGIGEYNKKNDSLAYNYWQDMIGRCYNEKEIIRDNFVYLNVSVCEEWHCFQNFARWFYKNYKFVDGVKFNLDKDLFQLDCDCKIYSPKTCVFLPQRINTFIVTKENYGTKRKDGIHIRVSDFDKKELKEIGFFETQEEANSAYFNARKIEAEKAKDYMRSLGIYSEEIIQKIR